MEKIHHVVFDIDGTLLDTERFVLLSLQRALKEIGIAEELENLRFSLGIPGLDALQRYALADPHSLLQKWDAYFCDYLDEIEPFAGISEVLFRLAELDVTLGIVTSKNSLELAQDFKKMEFAKLFPLCITAEQTTKHKPDSQPMEKYLELSGAKAEETLYIGDTAGDLSCAKGAGCLNALALWGRTDSTSLKADWYLSTPEEIFALLQE